ncbi:dihydropteroate synthase [Parapusillimonas sp. SGNA-6]|uniref:dihydropteroate synthase n=1 Tax=Parapedobacter sp. SGR-10 TaxID=2710879 RepID=UPI0013D20F21|nr:dihydropteroate synthase [Parapedobacter sp. SGR-10]NGF55171.1 dihydropteroate synthase [Parapedobacter sp. SGR-10]NGM90483.1 dihydropteroate synthase [Parapusillimonas sp. SGNA-6]
MPYFKTYPTQSIRVGDRLLTFEKPVIMGILNVTPDSFFDGGQHATVDHAIAHTRQMLEEGADIIDIGAFSSRPGATTISTQEEIDRSVPVVEALAKEFPDIILSVDTFRAEVAKTCIDAGAHIINDISGGNLDENMFATVAKLQVPYVLMHMRGTPKTMQQLTDYTDIVTDVATELGQRIAALRALGVKDIILDPGFGFAKTIEQNYELLLRTDELHYFGLPMLGGISRKSMIYKKLDTTPQEALNGTTALNTLLLERGVHILRVHDVKEAKQLINLFF